MIRIIQRLLQVAVILALFYVIWKPQILPSNFQPIGYSTQRWFFGNEVTVQSAQKVWQDRWNWLVVYVPPLAGATKTMFTSTQPITAEGVLQWFNLVLWKQPQQKLELIKNNYQMVPSTILPSVAPAASLSASPTASASGTW